MKTPTINNIKFQPLSFSDKENFEVTVNIDNFDRTRHRIVLQIDQKTYTLINNTQKIVLPRKAPTIPILPGLQPTANVWAKAYVYDFKADEIVLARKQEFAYSPILQNYFATDTLLSTTNMILGDFTKDKKVKSISGPFDTEGNVATQIKLGKKYIFTATPNQTVAEFYLLAIKWAYRLDDGELVRFKNQTEIANCTQGQIAVTFPKSFKASKIKVYGFYVSASERVCVEVGTDYVAEVVVVKEDEVLQPENESPTTPTENIQEQNSSTFEKVTIEQLENLFGVYRKYRDFRNEILLHFNNYCQLAIDSQKPLHIDTPLRKAHFFAQVGSETLGINPDWMVETDVIPYKSSNINTVKFGTRATNLINRGDLKEFCEERPQKKLLSYLYAQENGKGNGNGNEESGEGYKYRGRGLKQLTGKNSYLTASNFLNEVFPNEYINFAQNPDKVKEPKYAVLSAIAYWEKNNIWETADKISESTDENVKKIRKLVNGATAGWKEAKKYLEKGLEVFKNKILNAEESTDSNWHDPIDNPMTTNFYQNGNIDNISKIWGLFGDEIRREVNRKHTGLDLFAKKGSNIYACVDGVVYNRRWHSGYGNTITIKVSNPIAFINLKRSDYILKTTREQLQGANWSNDSQIYLLYAHLDDVKEFNFGDEVKCGAILGTSGRSGISNGTHAPHLHFEILCSYRMAVGTNYRINPALFIKFKFFDEQSDIEKSNQNIEKNKGKIEQFNGVIKLNEVNLF